MMELSRILNTHEGEYFGMFSYFAVFTCCFVYRELKAREREVQARRDAAETRKPSISGIMSLGCVGRWGECYHNS
jgi:hypothetical protein